MDFKELLLVIKKNLKFIIIFTLAIAVLVEAYSLFTSGGYNVYLPLSVYSKVGQQTPDNQFDGYDSVQAADKFGDTVVQWIKSPEISSAIYKKIEIPPGNALISFPQSFQAQKMAPQYVEVDFRIIKPDDGTKIAQALVAVLQEKADEANKYSGNAVFTIIGSEPIIAKNQARFILNGLLALLGGSIIAVFLVLLKEQ